MVGGCLQSSGYKSYPGGQDFCLGGKRNKFKFGVKLKELNFHLRWFPWASGNNLLCFFITQKARLTLNKKKTLSLIVGAADWGVGIKDILAFKHCCKNCLNEKRSLGYSLRGILALFQAVDQISRAKSYFTVSQFWFRCCSGLQILKPLIFFLHSLDCHLRFSGETFRYLLGIWISSQPAVDNYLLTRQRQLFWVI